MTHRIAGIVVGGLVLAAVTSLPNAVAGVYLAGRAGAAMLSTTLNSNTFNVVLGLLLPAAFIGLARPSGAGDLHRRSGTGPLRWSPWSRPTGRRTAPVAGLDDPGRLCRLRRLPAGRFLTGAGRRHPDGGTVGGDVGTVTAAAQNRRPLSLRGSPVKVRRWPATVDGDFVPVSRDTCRWWLLSTVVRHGDWDPSGRQLRLPGLRNPGEEASCRHSPGGPPPPVC